MNNSTTVH